MIEETSVHLLSGLDFAKNASPPKNILCVYRYYKNDRA